jgi:branched-chain amino acid transport system permease protein
VKVLRYWGLESALGAALLSAGLFLVALWGWEWGGNESKITHFFINVTFVVALQVFSGNSGILSFGQMAFVGTGAYVAAILTIDPLLKPTLLTGLPHFLETAHVSFGAAVLLAAAAGGVLAVASGLPILRLDGASAVIAILALLLIADVVFSAWIGVTRGAGGLYALPEETTLGRALLVAVIAVFVARWFKDSRTGLLLQGSREDAFSAASVGVSVRACRARAWILSGILSGAGGAVFAWWIGTISPTDFFLAPTFALIVMFIVGGTRTVSGAVVGAALVTLVQEKVRDYEDRSVDLGLFEINRLTGLTQMALVAMILAVMYFRREGIVGRRELDESLRALARAASPSRRRSSAAA